MKLSRGLIKKFFLDGISNYLFFVPLIISLNTLPFFFGLPYWNRDAIISFVVSSLFSSIVGGAIYGRVLNWWRKRLRYK